MRKPILVLPLLTLVLAACGGPPQALRRGTTAAAIGVAALDVQAAEAYTAAHTAALEASETREAYDAAMRPWDELETALRATSSSLAALEGVQNAWGAGGQENWLGVAACAAVALERLMAAATAVGLELPAEVASALEMVGSFAGGACPRRP